ncbi:hypothetical protein SAMN04487937_2811 [Halorubrum sodomense]|uniref:HTH domain-containing protein n=2 Tax=Halorubrum sodomense TaxID=35743 RepID=A0A1I6HQD4_HALSD|nr:hypothetical protein SAMN04487937_2811 [Halorubrum sodomense]
MTNALAGSWDEMSGRERVRAVMETLSGAATVQEISDRADVSRNTADDELKQMEADNRVHQTLVDGKKGYQLNPAKLFFDEIMELIEEHTRDELNVELVDIKKEKEELENEFGVESLTMFREQMLENEDISADELRERQNIASTWETLNMEEKLYRHALRLYDDVQDISSADSTTPTALP